MGYGIGDKLRYCMFRQGHFSVVCVLFEANGLGILRRFCDFFKKLGDFFKRFCDFFKEFVVINGP